jgi:hypothetical protein
MGKRKQSDSATGTMSSTETAAATNAPLPIETPAIQAAAETRIELPKIESTFIGPLQTDSILAAIAAQSSPAQAEAPRGGLPRYAFAASVAAAAVLGGLLGAAATAGFTREAQAPAAEPAAAVETRALKETVVRLGTELATVKASIDAANRATSSQLGKLAERFDRAEKAQAEPVAKLAKITESLDRLEKRPVAAHDVTGSVTAVDKQQSKPPVAEGWKLRDFYAGRAVVESRGGGVYEVGPGSNLPGLGKVETIKREDGRVVVVTPKGIIAAAIEQQQRRPHYAPYRYY